MRPLFIILLVLSLKPSFGQKPKNGNYIFKFFDLEYGKFHGTCKVIVIKDSVAVYALTDCHRAKGAFINSGIIVREKDGKWRIKHSGKKDDDYDEMPDSLSFEKKIFYTY